MPTPQSIILIVDDNPTNLSLLFDLLDKEGFEVLVSQSGESALKRAAHTHPDIILLDVMMPEMDGFETCKRLKAHDATRDIPVIFMTALSETASKLRGFELGAVDYVTKPIEPEEVVIRVRTHLSIQQLQYDLQQKNAQLAMSLEREQELNKLKSRFISMVSHEFKTPLTMISLSNNMLRRYIERMPPEKREEEFAAIDRTVERLSNLVSDVLMFSKVDTGKLTCQPEPTNVCPLCETLVARFQAMHEDTHTLKLLCPENLPLVFLDPKMFEQILSNLLSNAVKYSPNGGMVTLEVVSEPDACIFYVRDEGIGISEADQAHLFESFHRGENVGNIKGTGLGLSIVKQLVELHGGAIRAESNVDQGTTFTMTFPIAS